MAYILVLEEEFVQSFLKCIADAADLGKEQIALCVLNPQLLQVPSFLAIIQDAEERAGRKPTSVFGELDSRGHVTPSRRKNSHAQVYGLRRMGQGSYGDVVSAGFSIGTHVFQSDAAGNLNRDAA